MTLERSAEARRISGKAKAVHNETLALSLARRFPLQDAPSFRSGVNFQSSATRPIHRWFRYREGFSPAILDAVGKAERIFDPFCGCGTALIEATRRSISGYGTDVNPLAVFVARVKTRKYTAEQIHLFRHLVQASMEGGGDRWSQPAMPLLPKLFQPAVLDALLRLRAFIEGVEVDAVRDLLRLCWLNILERCSNVFKEGNGLKYRNKRRRPGRYVTIPDDVWIPKYFGSSMKAFVDAAWQAQCESVIQDIEDSKTQSRFETEIFQKSCLDADLAQLVPSCDAAVFSPPYANRFDYFEAFKLELWMGGFVQSKADMQGLRQKSMRNNLAVADGDFAGLPELEPFLDLMDPESSSVKMGIQNTLRGYFDDVRKLANNLSKIVVPKGAVACVVGNSAYAGVLIPTDVLCAAIFEKEGFKVKSIKVARHLTVSSQQRSIIPEELQSEMRESILICERS